MPPGRPNDAILCDSVGTAVRAVRQASTGDTGKFLHYLAAASLLSACAASLAAADAEFAIRWNPDEGGPQTATEVLAALGLEPGAESDFEVRYFKLAQPAQLPAGFAARG